MVTSLSLEHCQSLQHETNAVDEDESMLALSLVHAQTVDIHDSDN